MRGNIVHVGYIMGLLSRVRNSGDRVARVFRWVDSNWRTVRIQYLVRGQTEAGEKKKWVNLIMQIARQIAQLPFRLYACQPFFFATLFELLNNRIFNQICGSICIKVDLARVSFSATDNRRI